MLLRRQAACLLLLALVACRSVSTTTSTPIPTLKASYSPTAETPAAVTPTAGSDATETALDSTLQPLAATKTLVPTPPSEASDLGSGEFAPIAPENSTALIQVAEIVFSPWELVMALAWSPVGEVLAASAGDQLYLYRPLDEERLAILEVGALTHALAYSPDGVRLAAGSRDGIVRVWDVSTISDSTDSALPSLLLDAHRKGVNSVAFSPDGSALASGGNDAVARFWDPYSGEMIGSVVGGTFAIPSIAFSPDSSVLAVVNGNAIRLRDIETEGILGTFLADTSLYSLAYHPEGILLATGGTDNLVRLWRPEEAFRTGVDDYPEPILLEAHNGDPGSFRALVWQVVFSPDGRLLASAGGDASIRLWDISSGALLTTLAIHTDAVTCLAFSPDGRLLASGGLDGVIRIWAVHD